MIQLTKQELKGLKDVVERIPQFEEKIGIRLDNISFSDNGIYFKIHGDFFMDNLEKFDDYYSISIYATLYDEDNDIITSELTTILKEDFLGFETFTIWIYTCNGDIDLKSIKKIRIYAKPFHK